MSASDKSEKKVHESIKVWICADPTKSGITPEIAAQITKLIAGVAPGAIEFRGPLNSEDCKTILGWEEEVEGGTKFGEKYLLEDREGKKIRCKNNPHNRPFYPSNCEDRIQDILNLNWELNGETIIVGDMGNVVDGQHTLCAVPLAEQDRQREKLEDGATLKWGKNWPTEVCIDKIVIFGVSEEDNVVNTCGTGKGRTLADVIYRSPYFKDGSEAIRRLAASVTDRAIRQLWHRTGVSSDAFSPRRTHAEAIAFLEDHKRLLQCVKHVLKTNKRPTKEDGTEDTETGVIGDSLPLGYVCAATYLMATSAMEREDVADYYGNENRSQKNLKMSLFDTATEFWTEFSSEKMKPLRDALARVGADLNTSGVFKSAQKDYILCTAWKLYQKKKEITGTALKIKYTETPTGKVLKDAPDFGGIDCRPAHSEKPAPPAPSTAVQNGVEQRKKKEEATKNGDTTDNGTLESVREQAAGTVLLCKPENATKWSAWAHDAETVGKALGRKSLMCPRGCLEVAIKKEDLEAATDALLDAKYEVSLVEEKAGKWEVMSTLKPGKKTAVRK